MPSEKVAPEAWGAEGAGFGDDRRRRPSVRRAGSSGAGRARSDPALRAPWRPRRRRAPRSVSPPATISVPGGGRCCVKPAEFAADALGPPRAGSGRAAGRGWPAPRPFAPGGSPRRRALRGPHPAAAASAGRRPRAAGGDRLIGAEEAEHRPRQGGRRRRRPCARPAPAPARRCRTTAPGRAPRGRGRRCGARSVVGLGIEQADARRQRRVRPARRDAPAPPPPAPPRVDRHRLPAAIRPADQHPAAAGDAALRRKGRGQHAMLPRRRSRGRRQVPPRAGRARGCPASCRRYRRRRAPGPSARTRAKASSRPASRVAAVERQAAAGPAAACQATGTGPQSPASSAALSSAPVRSSASRRRRGGPSRAAASGSSGSSARPMPSPGVVSSRAGYRPRTRSHSISAAS